MAACGLCEPINLTEPEPRSFTDFLRREEWIKCSRQNRRRHPGTRIADRDHYIGARDDVGVAGGVLSVDGYIPSLDSDPSAAPKAASQPRQFAATIAVGVRD